MVFCYRVDNQSKLGNLLHENLKITRECLYDLI